MGNIWKSLKKTMDGVLKKASEITREAADRAEEVTRLGKIRLEIFQIKKDVEKKQAELGSLVYDEIKDSDKKRIEISENMRAIIKEIKDLEKKLKAKEEEYNKIKAEGDDNKKERGK
ncbi:MAG: hypothetical protein DRP91_03575 [Candidatus Neomarinimicrobiota bacterium]|mgnify:CR=1 FL=1|nr:hypothetical protein [Candidatus Neomarinimicrobiota bacterium]RKY49707.1 MAG: hypothetical protein DRP91_03575 [Candidatus Neomarinimicrobiota bacterium]